MTYDTINDAQTIAGGEGTLLAGRYRIVKQLGQGGMGSVWLVEDTQLDDKPFAVKMLPSILVSNKRAYRQLKDEALVAMRLVHPNIVQIRAFEENNGNPFLVMDYIDGQALDDYLAEHFPADATPANVARPPRPCCKGEGALATSPGTTGVSPVAGGLSEAEVLRILRPIAAALDYAHGEGVVHRDVKPANMMIRKDGHPYILDFGIAREIQETMTRVTGKLSSGTLLYMSPEQLMGEQPKPAQDVYSFAAMVYECLKGEPPFSHGQIEFQIMNKQPESPPGGTQLVASVMSGLAKRPENRPATCAAVLEGKDSGRVEHLERADGVGRARTPAAPQGWSRSRATAAILVLVAALLAFAGGILWVVRKNDNRPVYESAPMVIVEDSPVQKPSLGHFDACTNEAPRGATSVGEAPGIIFGTTNDVGGTKAVNRPMPIRRPPLIVNLTGDTNVVRCSLPMKPPATSVYESAPMVIVKETPVQNPSLGHFDACTNVAPRGATSVGGAPGIIFGTTNDVGGTKAVNRPLPIRRPPLIVNQTGGTNVVRRSLPMKRPATYVVQPSDTLMSIAARFYGSRNKWRDIQKANMTTIPIDGRVRAGMTLRLPDLPEEEWQVESVEAPPSPPEVKIPDVDTKKMLEQGYRYGTRNQLATSEEQLCLGLIKRAINREWDKESFEWHSSLRPIQAKIQLGVGGMVRGFTILSGSGDAEVDRTAQNALTRLRGTKINGLTEQFLKKYPELTIVMEPTKP